MTKRLDPDVKATRRRYRLAAKLAKDIGVPPLVALGLIEGAQDLRDMLGEDAALHLLELPPNS